MPQSGKVAAAIFGANQNSYLMYLGLRRRGIDTFVFAENANDNFGNIAITRCPPIGDSEALLSCLNSFAAANPDLKLVVLPSSDRYARFFAGARDRLPQAFILKSPSADTVETCADKGRFREFCAKNGLNAPETFVFASRDEFERSNAVIPYPVIVKRVVSGVLPESAMPKVTLAADRDQLLEIGRNVWKHGSSLLLQEYIPGTPEQIVFIGGYVDPQNGISDLFVGTKEMEYPLLGGTTTACRLEWQEDAAEAARQLLRLLDYEGLFDIEYKRDPRSGALRIIEVNPRIGFWHRASEDDNMDIISCCVLTASGARARGQMDYRAHAEGRVWIEPNMHLIACTECYGLFGGLRRWVRDMRRPTRVRDTRLPGWRRTVGHTRNVLGRFWELGLGTVLRGVRNESAR